MYACNGILFNHESPTRGETFVTRKITRAVAKIALGIDDVLYLGNLDAKRDWGHAKDYVEAMWKILQQEKAEDFVIATGITTSVRDFVKKSFLEAGIEIEFSGNNEEEIATVKNCNNPEYNLKQGKTILRIDKDYYRPSEVDLLVGDPSKAQNQLNWKPKYDLSSLIAEMVSSDIALFKKELDSKNRGHNVHFT